MITLFCDLDECPYFTAPKVSLDSLGNPTLVVAEGVLVEKYEAGTVWVCEAHESLVNQSIPLYTEYQSHPPKKV